jgi:S-formylglutathione hydrolase FrmB
LVFPPAAAISGALNAPQELGDKRPEFRDQLLKVFGPPGSAVRADNNLFSLFQTTNTKDPVYFYLACGSGDDFLPVNREFAAQLSPRNVAYEYCETDGGDGWDYWDRSVPDVLRAAARVLTDHHGGSSE